jgi:hypothetical protein
VDADAPRVVEVNISHFFLYARFHQIAIKDFTKINLNIKCNLLRRNTKLRATAHRLGQPFDADSAF